MADDVTWTGDSKYWPPDVKRATDVIRRWLRARKRSAQLTTDMLMTVGAEGTIDIHFKSLDQIYKDGARQASRDSQDLVHSEASTVHVDPDSVS